MNSALKNGNNFSINSFQNTATSAQSSMQPSKEEIENIIGAGQEIDRAFSMFEEERFKEIIEICKTVHANAIEKCSEPSVQNIEKKLLEAGLEIALAGNNEVSREIIKILGSSKISNERPYDEAADACWTILDPYVLLRYAKEWMMKGLLDKTIRQNEDLKCMPYFLGKVFKGGLYGVKQDDEQARKYLQIATERKYVPHIKLMKKQVEEYKLMLEARKSDNPIFSNLPAELIRYITRMRIEATISSAETRQKTLISRQ